VDAMSKDETVFDIPDTVKIVFFIEDGVQCWSIYQEDIEKCQRRGYQHTVVEYAASKP
jgi:hypothetical protein